MQDSDDNQFAGGPACGLGELLEKEDIVPALRRGLEELPKLVDHNEDALPMLLCGTHQLGNDIRGLST
jgi:hypothetical protein